MDNKPIGVQVLILDGWEVRLYMIIPSFYNQGFGEVNPRKPQRIVRHHI